MHTEFYCGSFLENPEWTWQDNFKMSVRRIGFEDGTVSATF
jgi:hypothetical protein